MISRTAYLLFFAGAMMQAFWLIRSRYSVRLIAEFFLCLAIVFATGFQFFMESGRDFYKNLPFVALVFSILFSLWFRNYILCTISELTVLVFTVTFWYVYATTTVISSNFKFILAPIFAIPSAAAVYTSVTDNELSALKRLLFYIWYQFIVVVLIAIQLPFNPMPFFSDNSGWDGIMHLNVFAAGATFMFLAVNAMQIIRLYPYLSPRLLNFALDEGEEQAVALIEKFADYRLKWKTALLIILVQSTALFLNYLKNVIPEDMVINFTLLIVPQTISFFDNRVRTEA